MAHCRMDDMVNSLVKPANPSSRTRQKMLGNGLRDRPGSSRDHRSASLFALITKMTTRASETSSGPSWRQKAWNRIPLGCEDLWGVWGVWGGLGIRRPPNRGGAGGQSHPAQNQMKAKIWVGPVLVKTPRETLTWDKMANVL